MDLSAPLVLPTTRIARLIAESSTAELSNEVRLKLGDDCQVLVCNSGLVVRNDVSSRFLPGKDLRQIVPTVLRYLNGELTIGDVYKRIGSERRAAATKLIRFLKGNGFAKVYSEECSDFPQAIQQKFKNQIDFLAHFFETPLEHFMRFRASRVLLVGAGLAFRSCAKSVLRYGLANLALLHSNVDDCEIGELLPVLKSQNDRIQNHISVSAQQGEPLILQDFDLVAYCSSQPSLAEVWSLNQACAVQGKPLLPALAFGNRSVMGPLLRPYETGCWTCGLLRLAAEIVDPQVATQFLQAQTVGLTATGAQYETGMARILGTDVAFEIFKALTGRLRPDLEHSILLQVANETGSIAAELIPQSLCGCSRACEIQVFSKSSQVSDVSV